MKKIGIITYHNPCNYGATLQSLATVKYLKKKNFDVSVINYVPSSRKNFGKLKDTINTINGNVLKKIIIGFIKNLSYIKMRKTFDKYSVGLLPLTKEYKNDEELISNPPVADIYCTGSDQVWNNYYTKKFEKPFFLDFVPNGKPCFSFAASFGKSSFNDGEKKELKELLKKYEFISVRETDGLGVLNEIGIENAFQILDPTLMLDFGEWDKIVSNNIKESDYVLVYQLHGDSKTYEIAKKFAKDNNLKIIKINTMYHHYKIGSKNIMLPTLEKFLGYIKNAKYVFTDSFHGVAFSLMFNRLMGVTLPHNFSNRITSLLNQIDGNSFIIDNYDDWYKGINNIDINKIQLNLVKLQSVKTKIIDEYLNKKR